MLFQAEEGDRLVLSECAWIFVGYRGNYKTYNISPGCLLNTTVVQRKLGESSRFEYWDTRWR